ncbi:NALCN channel auxiliary factor 1-like [Menidia menidia]
MTGGAGTCWPRGDRFWPPRDTRKPFLADPERAQRWRLSLASLLFLTILLSDHLWVCAEAKLARTRDKRAHVHAHARSRPHPHPHPPHSSLRGTPRAIFIGNSTGQLWRLETCSPDRDPDRDLDLDPNRDRKSADCLSLAGADQLCARLSAEGARAAVNVSDLYLSFCSSYSLLDLFGGSSSPDHLNCSLDVLGGGWGGGGAGGCARGRGGGDASRCTDCVEAYRRYDQHAQEKWEDFEMLARKYEPGPYSVRTCMERCKMAYKPWLCAQYFPPRRGGCRRTVPCQQYCLEVQQSCPFILPDNEDLIHGGSPSFICTGQKPPH